MDSISQTFFPKIQFLLPSNTHGIFVEDLGRAMVVNAEAHLEDADTKLVERLEYPQFVEILGGAVVK